MPKAPDAATVVRDPILLLAFGFGSGLVPRVPGTAGSVVGLLLYLPMLAIPFWGRAALVVGLCLVGVAICGYAAKRLGVHDHPGIVWDEFCGMWLTLLAIPLNLYWAMSAFALFRLFDIWKPWPVRLADKKVSGGLGIMLDDVLASGMAVILLLLANYGITHS